MLCDKGCQQGIQQLHDIGVSVYFKMTVLFDGSNALVFYVACYDP